MIWKHSYNYEVTKAIADNWITLPCTATLPREWMLFLYWTDSHKHWDIEYISSDKRFITIANETQSITLPQNLV